MAEIELKNSQGKVIGTIDADQWMASSSEDKQAFLAQFEPPTQRMRALAQGATMGFSDELIAAAQNPMAAFSALRGNTDGSSAAFDEAVKTERDALSQYRSDYPVSSIAWEAGGALAPLALSPFTGGASGAAAAPTVGRLAAITGGAVRGAVSGAKYGAAYGVGTGEGGLTQEGILNRGLNGVEQGVVGAIGGGALGAGGTAIKETVVNGFTNWVRNKAGDRMAGAVNAAIQKMAQDGGLTVDEVVEGVRNGSLMAENRSLTSMVRRFYAEGGPAGAEIKRTLTERPGATRAEALTEVQGSLGRPGNPVANRVVDEKAAKAAEDAAYEPAFAAMPAVPDNVVDILTDVGRRAPQALRNAVEVARVKGLPGDLVDEVDGKMVFTRAPSLEEAEMVYRQLRSMTNNAYKDNAPLGEALKGLRDGVKTGLDAASDPLKAARALAAGIRDARDAYVAGQKAASQTPDELAVIIPEIEAKGGEVFAAFREGLLTSYRGGLSKPSAAPGMIRNMNNEGTGAGTALRMALPPGAAPAVTQKLQVADDAQAAYSNIVGGSQTAQTLMAPNINQGVSVAQDAVSGMGGDLMGWARLIGTLAGRANPGLTQAQRLEVARIVTSKDPELVLRALKDNSMIGKLQSLTDRAVAEITRVAPRAVAPAATASGLLSGQ